MLVSCKNAIQHDTAQGVVDTTECSTVIVFKSSGLVVLPLQGAAPPVQPQKATAASKKFLMAPQLPPSVSSARSEMKLERSLHLMLVLPSLNFFPFFGLMLPLPQRSQTSAATKLVMAAKRIRKRGKDCILRDL
jgi:hypothetical protein